MLSVRFYFILLPPALQINDGLTSSGRAKLKKINGNKKTVLRAASIHGVQRRVRQSAATCCSVWN
jgi:hypothetical protein